MAILKYKFTSKRGSREIAYDLAADYVKTVPQIDCINVYQTVHDGAQRAKIVEFKNHFAVQMGDCGEYVKV